MTIDANLVQGFEIGLSLGIFIGVILSGLVAAIAVFNRNSGDRKNGR